MVRAGWGSAAWSMAAVLLLGAVTTTDAATRRNGQLPDAVAKAVKKAFPEATITGFGRERENGVTFYEVNLNQNGNRIEVEVDPDGAIGEFEAVVDLKEAPEGVAERIRRATQGGKIIRVERHERRGVARGGRFVPLEKPRTFYEVKFQLNGKKHEITVRHTDTAPLPKKAEDALKAAFRRAKIGGAEVSEVKGLKLYSATVTRGRRASQVVVTADGVITEVATETPVKSLPKAMAQALKKETNGARVTSVERVEVKADVTSGKAVPLKKAKEVYRAELVKKSMKAQITMAPDGKVLEKPVWKKMHDEDEDDEDDDDDDDDD